MRVQVEDGKAEEKLGVFDDDTLNLLLQTKAFLNGLGNTGLAAERDLGVIVTGMATVGNASKIAAAEIRSAVHLGSGAGNDFLESVDKVIDGLVIATCV